MLGRHSFIVSSNQFLLFFAVNIARHQLLKASAPDPSPRTPGRSVSPMRSASPLHAAARPRSTSPVNAAAPPAARAASRLQQPRVVVARPAKHAAAAVADRVAAYVEPTTLNQPPSCLDQLDVGFDVKLGTWTCTPRCPFLDPNAIFA